jgi:hypothetical protein
MSGPGHLEALLEEENLSFEFLNSSCICVPKFFSFKSNSRIRAPCCPSRENASKAFRKLFGVD